MQSGLQSDTGAEQNEPLPYPMRLQKYLARAGVASRRGSEDLMSAGRVTVNGVVVSELGSKVDPLTDTVRVDGKLVGLDGPGEYLMMHKPAGYLVTMTDPQGRPTVRELLPSGYASGLFPVGRLDLDTTGLLLFMTDGELAHQLLHPKHHVNKRYLVEVAGDFGPADAALLSGGVVLHDGLTQPAGVEILGAGSADAGGSSWPDSRSPNEGSTRVRITISEGRKRQVKRMFAYTGHPVISLHREAFGPLVLGELPLGCCRPLSQTEIATLKSAAASALSALSASPDALSATTTGLG